MFARISQNLQAFAEMFLKKIILKKLRQSIACNFRLHLMYRSYFSGQYLLGYGVSKKSFPNFLTELSKKISPKKVPQ